MTGNTFKAFEDDVTVVGLDGLSIENGFDAVVLHGDIVIGKDEGSLEKLRALIRILQGIEQAAASGERSRSELAAVSPSDEVCNPFL